MTKQATTRQLRSYGLLMTTAFALLASYLLYKHDWQPSPASWVLYGIATAFLLLGLLAPSALRPIYKAWMALADLLNRIMTPVILSLFFFLVLTPVGLLMRLFGYDPLRRGKKASRQASMWVNKTLDERGQKHMENPF